MTGQVKNPHLIIDLERSVKWQGKAVFWGPNGSGYTADFDKAGRYEKDAAFARITWPQEHIIIVPESELVDLIKRTVDLHPVKKRFSEQIQKHQDAWRQAYPETCFRCERVIDTENEVFCADFVGGICCEQCKEQIELEEEARFIEATYQQYS